MGYWRTERGIGGDSWADELGNCMKRLSKIKAKPYEKLGGKHLDSDDGTGHEITMQEFADLVEFCTRGHIKCEIHYPDGDSSETKYFLRDSERPLSQLHDKDVETYPNRGQIHCPELEMSEDVPWYDKAGVAVAD